MANYRDAKINDAVCRAVSVIIGEVKDPRVSGYFLSITGADVSHDLKYAKIFWSAVGTDAASVKEISRGLKSCSAFVRRRLAEEVNLRVTPEIQFVPDKSLANGAHIEALLRSIEKRDGDKKENNEDR